MGAVEAVEVEHEEKTEQEHALESAPVVLRPYKNPRIKLVPQGATLEPETITKVRPDLNFERHAALLFAPAHSKNLHKPRSRTWVETLPDGKKITCSILVEPFRGKIPTTKTRKVYLALQKLLEEKGWNEEQNTVFSTRELAKALGIKWAGKKTIKELYAELDKLRLTPYSWKHAFVAPDGSVYSILDRVNILDKLSTLAKEDREKEELFKDLHVFRFNEYIRKNLQANKTRPTDLVALTLKSEFASVLYAHLDIVLYGKAKYERTTANLFQEDLRLDGSRYQYPSKRKIELDKAIKHIQGKPISDGVLELCVVKTKDLKDWKLVATKSSLKKKPKLLSHAPEPDKPIYPPEEKERLFSDAMAVLQTTKEGNRFFLRATLAAYPYYGVIDRALSEWKADGGARKEKPFAYFKAILHRIVHLEDHQWLEPCFASCKYREN